MNRPALRKEICEKNHLLPWYIAAALQLCGSVMNRICSQFRSFGIILKAFGTFPLRYFFITSRTPSYISFTRGSSSSIFNEPTSDNCVWISVCFSEIFSKITSANLRVRWPSLRQPKNNFIFLKFSSRITSVDRLTYFETFLRRVHPLRSVWCHQRNPSRQHRAALPHHPPSPNCRYPICRLYAVDRTDLFVSLPTVDRNRLQCWIQLVVVGRLTEFFASI